MSNNKQVIEAFTNEVDVSIESERIFYFIQSENDYVVSCLTDLTENGNSFLETEREPLNGPLLFSDKDLAIDSLKKINSLQSKEYSLNHTKSQVYLEGAYFE